MPSDLSSRGQGHGRVYVQWVHSTLSDSPLPRKALSSARGSALCCPQVDVVVGREALILCESQGIWQVLPDYNSQALTGIPLGASKS